MSPSPASENYDAIIIGAGPAGSSAGALLAEYGHRVLILEREKFPRYHIGESLIPFTFQPLQRLGMIPKMKGSHFVKKYSVRFVQPEGGRSQPFYFFNRYDKDTIAQSWQVLPGGLARVAHAKAGDLGQLAIMGKVEAVGTVTFTIEVTLSAILKVGIG